MKNQTKQPRVFEYNFKLEWIMASLQGKKIQLVDPENEVTVVFHPAQGGVFLTHEQYNRLRQSVAMETIVQISTQDTEALSDILHNVDKYEFKQKIAELNDEQLAELLEYRNKHLKS